ncbi:MAG TPA: molybdate ABC transporter substrate-binding protein [Syntrophomonas sp.]|nr:molybdate ABC transporter substrate-binding protein [Syntrophomonas sp.]
MTKWKRLLAVLISLLVVTGLTGCGKSDTGDQAKKQNNEADQAIKLNVSAAASLKGAMDEINGMYTKAHPGSVITISYGASGALQQQIEQGADVDLFLSAATKQMDQLKDKEMIMEDTERDLLGNQLVLVVPADSSIDLKDFNGVTNVDVKKLALGEPKSVPAGQYAEEVFTKLGILDSIKSKVVYAQNVTEVLTWVETGNADAGVVYASDAKNSSQVKVVAAAAEDTHSPIVYPAAVLKASKNADDAKTFLEYLGGSEAKTVFEKYGFTVK